MLGNALFALAIVCALATPWLEHRHLRTTRLSLWGCHPDFPSRLKLPTAAAFVLGGAAVLLTSSTGYWVLFAMFAPRLPMVLWHNHRLTSAAQPADPA